MSEPVSIWALERLHLGELDSAEAAAVRARVAEDPVAQAALRTIEAGERMRPLPASEPRGLPVWLWPSLALAAGLLLFVGSRFVKSPPDVVGIKGAGDLSLGLVVQRAGRPVADASIREGDAIKLVVTCAPPAVEAADVSVEQGGERTVLPAGPAIQCGNAVPIPGAFSLNVGPARICATVGERPPVCVEITVQPRL